MTIEPATPVELSTKIVFPELNILSWFGFLIGETTEVAISLLVTILKRSTRVSVGEDKNVYCVLFCEISMVVSFSISTK